MHEEKQVAALAAIMGGSETAVELARRLIALEHLDAERREWGLALAEQIVRGKEEWEAKIA